MMDEKLEKYLEKLEEEGLSCYLLINGEEKFRSKKKRIEPLRDLMTLSLKKGDGDEFILVDKLIGGAAYCYSRLLKIDKIYTPLVSQRALYLNKNHEIDISYREKIDHVINEETGEMGPMEKISTLSEDPLQIVLKIEEFLNENKGGW